MGAHDYLGRQILCLWLTENEAVLETSLKLLRMTLPSQLYISCRDCDETVINVTGVVNIGDDILAI